MAQRMTESTFWILASLAEGRRHGYAILRDVERMSDGAVALRVTTLYAALERIVREGLAAPDGEEVVDGRARRYYVLADAGIDALELEAAALEARAKAARGRLASRETRTARESHA
ncbi:PadR family transcriptional regulator [Agrococcus jejuensis]|uniref:DNA-binding transcriptional regulator, PadR family n=1 Tax=Agrococcus jejuensis TaxID=399736 RepID=A0A1G8ESW8_9MICO|nr:PadR family transcriptional regulator [Agrococcus jejuensis]SDH73011.1 DNA-binding transcriptional regulator, PadR family [Agrococcus jejuensis]